MKQNKHTLATLIWLANCNTPQELEEFRAQNPKYIPGDLAALAARQFLRQIWKGGQHASTAATLILCGQATLRSIINSVKQAVAADAESQLSEEAALLLLPTRVDWPGREMIYTWPSALQRDLYLLLQKSHLAKICRRRECTTPYFVAARITQEYCSPECAEAMQNEWRRKWWSEHGKEWRKKRKRGQKSRKRLIGPTNPPAKDSPVPTSRRVRHCDVKARALERCHAMMGGIDRVSVGHRLVADGTSLQTHWLTNWRYIKDLA